MSREQRIANLDRKIRDRQAEINRLSPLNRRFPLPHVTSAITALLREINRLATQQEILEQRAHA